MTSNKENLTSEYTRCYHFFMFKKVLLILCLFIALPAFSGEFEEASKTNTRIFLYLFTPECGYCKKFDPTFDYYLKKYGKKCAFIKINANTEYGAYLMRSVRASYVPYVALINNHKQTLQRVAPTCLLNNACTKDAIEKFIDN